MIDKSLLDQYFCLMEKAGYFCYCYADRAKAD